MGYAAHIDLNAEVPAGALVTAVRQLVLFANPSPTGWRQIGMSALNPAPETDTSILLRRRCDAIFTRIRR